ncbi:hypothetical protein RJT34_28415 [Clitoria ternatea]|uniref:Uncharacterized protein n=1 Tax=Clitoria ternatea TaxID=43366 RepID=A0AAN9IBI3_CLITE
MAAPSGPALDPRSSPIGKPIKPAPIGRNTFQAVPVVTPGLRCITANPKTGQRIEAAKGKIRRKTCCVDWKGKGQGAAAEERRLMDEDQRESPP